MSYIEVIRHTNRLDGTVTYQVKTESYDVFITHCVITYKSWDRVIFQFDEMSDLIEMKSKLDKAGLRTYIKCSQDQAILNKWVRPKYYKPTFDLDSAVKTLDLYVHAK
jgi:hypothetical protein